MVIPKRQRIILKSKTAGNSEYGSNSSVIVVSEYISLPNLLAVLVFHPRVLADGVGINLVPLLVVIHKLNDHAYAIVVLEQATFYPYSIVKALASEFNFSHSILFYS